MPGPPTYVVDMHHSKRRRIRLCWLPSKRCRCSCVVWGWSLYNIVESESDPLTREAVDLFKKEPLKGKWEVNLHTPTKFGEDQSKDLGGDWLRTHKQTNAARIIIWFAALLRAQYSIKYKRCTFIPMPFWPTKPVFLSCYCWWFCCFP